ncbi:NAD-dependent deacylase [Lysinibacillus agricola]|uniref:protein acetyllysine N-acetyltransferase n=1 Tax=Lysinibacillus agricola TaxID=2590012 RepID=A0ABX7ANZ9_9BACI|nr:MULTISPECIES: NAD-dependent deacylase [Lysinibacillus]KOS59861.1 NAD-dependent deacetylase [Lysinibacillus sp. FJAT-14222]QQP10638.1 NAD-dependent deacylase [Lysinibacillus agricola]
MTIERLSEWLQTSSSTVILTGAGMSTESGIPDFRSASGWWNNIDPRTVATTEALAQNYSLFHEFYKMRIENLEKVAPHEGHQILADWEKRGIVSLVATQNVDGFHQLAGSQRVEELHGSIRSVRCHRCQQAAPMESFLHKESCAHCGGKLRPNVVLFGESLPQASWHKTMEAIKAAELVVVIGTSLEVYPVNQLPMMTKGKTVYINLDIAQHEAQFDVTIEGKIKEVLQQLQI